jgi:head-tail adaptor
MTAPVLRESLTIQENVPDPVSVTSLTRTSTTATVTTAAPHGYASNDYVTVAGSTPAGYNGRPKITVTGPSSFTYPVSGVLATPATGTISVTYYSDAQGGREISWSTFRTVRAELIPVKAWEKLQVQALQGQLDYRFRVHAVDANAITNAMRILWTPQWPAGQAPHTLEIHGVLPDGDGRQWALIDCGETV